MPRNLLIVLNFPDDGLSDDDVDADGVASILVDVLNEDRQRNADEAGRPDYYKPIMVNAIPSPQWVSGADLALLMQSIHLLQQAKKFAAEEGRYYYPDAYRIGWLPWERWSNNRTARMLEPTLDTRGAYRPSSDRWRRPWQAEWSGCRRAVRAYTRLGAIRKGMRRMRAEEGR